VRLVAPLVVALLLVPGCATRPGETAPPVSFEAIRFEVMVDATTQRTFTAILFPNETPATYAFMKNLTTQGYYDGREFTRVIPGFVIQQVDRSGGATDTKETIPLEAGRNVTFSGGALGIARGDLPDSGGPEFFVMDFATSRLHGNFTAWAQVVDGLDVVHAIARVPSVRNPGCGAPQANPNVSTCFLGAPPNDVANPPVSTFDQEAVVPPKILTARMTTLALPASVAAQYPLQVAPTQSTNGVRYTLEWPRDLRPGHASTITWYAWNVPSGGATDAPAPDLAKAYALVQGPATNQTLQPKADPADARILHFTWTPPAAGSYHLSLRNATGEMATANVTAPLPNGAQG
jgi:cyclophilin family peptidyl-prolyl cis-trans isomerase